MKTETLLTIGLVGIGLFLLMPKQANAMVVGTTSNIANTAGQSVASVPINFVQGLFNYGYNAGENLALSLQHYLGWN